jgi:hypothetical protein
MRHNESSLDGSRSSPPHERKGKILHYSISLSIPCSLRDDSSSTPILPRPSVNSSFRSNSEAPHGPPRRPAPPRAPRLPPLREPTCRGRKTVRTTRWGRSHGRSSSDAGIAMTSSATYKHCAQRLERQRWPRTSRSSFSIWSTPNLPFKLGKLLRFLYSVDSNESFCS